MCIIGVKEGDYSILNGVKKFIAYGISGNISVVIVRTGKKGDSHGDSNLTKNMSWLIFNLFL